MMDMMSTAVVMTVLGVVLLAGTLGFVALRVLGAREVQGDHPGEQGYVRADHVDD